MVHSTIYRRPMEGHSQRYGPYLKVQRRGSWIWLPLMCDGQMLLTHAHMLVFTVVSLIQASPQQTTPMGSTKWVPATVLLWALHAAWRRRDIFQVQSGYLSTVLAMAKFHCPFFISQKSMINSVQHCSQ